METKIFKVAPTPSSMPLRGSTAREKTGLTLIGASPQPPVGAKGGPLTSYEKARLLGTRASQLSAGAEPLVEVKPSKNGFINFLEVAELEYKRGLIPINIIRPLPNGTSIRIKIRPRTV